MVSILNWMMTLVVVTFVSACAKPRSPRLVGRNRWFGFSEGPTAMAMNQRRSSATDERDPFAAQPDTAESLTNVSFHLEDVLENGALKDACAVWERDPTNRRKSFSAVNRCSSTKALTVSAFRRLFSTSFPIRCLRLSAKRTPPTDSCRSVFRRGPPPGISCRP